MAPDQMPAKYGCTACHAVDHKVVGPAFKDVAAKYKGKDVEATLAEKVKNGGAGVWGQIPMTPNPQVPDAGPARHREVDSVAEVAAPRLEKFAFHRGGLPMRTMSRVLLRHCCWSCSARTAARSRRRWPRATPSPIDLAGEWRAQLQFSSGAFASIKDLEFMYSFNQGGTHDRVVELRRVAAGAAGLRDLAEGRGQEFEAKYEFYVTKAPAAFDEIAKGGGWGLAGRGVFVERITLSEDGKSFTSKIKYDQFDTAGKPAEGGGEATGKGVKLAF